MAQDNPNEDGAQEPTDEQLDAEFAAGSKPDAPAKLTDESAAKPGAALPPKAQPPAATDADADAESAPESGAEAEADEKKPAKKDAEPESETSDALKLAEEAAAKKQQEESARRVAAAAERLESEERRKSEAPDGKPLDAAARLAELATVLKDVQLPAATDDDPDATVTIAQMAEDYPAVMRSIVAVAERIADEKTKAIQERLDRVTATIEDREAAEARDNLIAQLEGAHADVRQIADSTEYSGWLKKQSQAMQALEATGNPGDVRVVLEAYKASQDYRAWSGKRPAKPVVPESAEVVAAREAREKRDGLLAATSRTRRTLPRTPEAEPTDDDLDKEFEAEAKAAQAAKAGGR